MRPRKVSQSRGVPDMNEMDGPEAAFAGWLALEHAGVPWHKRRTV